MNIDFFWAVLDSKLGNQNLGNGKMGDPIFFFFLINEFNLVYKGMIIGQLINKFCGENDIYTNQAR